MTAAVVSLCTAQRLAHLRVQLAAVGSDALRVVVWLGEDDPPVLDADIVLRVPPGRGGLRLAAARNLGGDTAAAAGADLLVFLDADCVPGEGMLRRYREAALRHPGAVLCGPVTYLSAGADASDPGALAALRSPHPARPDPPAGTEREATAAEYPLYWSLSFAMTRETWAAAPRFDEGYEGYGGEDTDFAFALRDAKVPLAWVGGADAYHQHHETQSPPWAHLDDILRNGERFAARWGEWPMTGWLDAFAAAGAIRRDGDRWVRTA